MQIVDAPVMGRHAVVPVVRCRFRSRAHEGFSQNAAVDRDVLYGRMDASTSQYKWREREFTDKQGIETLYTTITCYVLPNIWRSARGRMTWYYSSHEQCKEE